jgi:hypothetical protein
MYDDLHTQILGEIAALARVVRFPELTGGGMHMKRSLDLAAIAMTSLLLLAFAVLSLRGMIDPQAASARFGTPVSDIAGSLFYRVYLSRNLVIVASGAIFLLRRQWTPLAVLLTITAALPLFDMSALLLSGITPPVFHPVALALIAITAALLWRRAAASPASASSGRPNLDLN